MNDLLTREWRENPLSAWLLALGILAGAIAVFLLVRWLVVRRLGGAAKRTKNWVDDLVVDVIQRTKTWFIILLAAVAAAQILTLPAGALGALRSVLVVGSLLQLAIWGNGLISFWVRQYDRTRSDASGAATIQAVGFLGRLALAVVIILTALRNFGVDITALVAGLGIGGIAIALAAQNILGDLFAALSIVLDRPFVIGDFIVVDNLSGTVEHVGLKTTRIRSLGGEQIVVSNTDLLKSRISNYRRLAERRVVLGLLVSHETSPAVVARLPQMLREIVERQAPVRFERAHFVRISELGLQLEVVYHVLSSDYNLHMDIQQAVSLAILDALRGEGVSLASSTRITAAMAGAAAVANEAS